jgi:ribokinase
MEIRIPPGPIVVIGSINMDLVCRVQRMPAAGETILGSEVSTLPGGKGANQAVAAAKLGAEVHLIGRVGDDDFGSR